MQIRVPKMMRIHTDPDPDPTIFALPRVFSITIERTQGVWGERGLQSSTLCVNYILSGLRRSHLYFYPGLRRSHLYFFLGLTRIHLYFVGPEEESFIFCQDWRRVIYILSRLRRSHLYFVRTDKKSFIFCQNWGGVIYILLRTEEESFIFLPRNEEESFIFCPGLRRSWTSTSWPSSSPCSTCGLRSGGSCRLSLPPP